MKKFLYYISILSSINYGLNYINASDFKQFSEVTNSLSRNISLQDYKHTYQKKYETNINADNSKDIEMPLKGKSKIRNNILKAFHNALQMKKKKDATLFPIIEEEKQEQINNKQNTANDLVNFFGVTNSLDNKYIYNDNQQIYEQPNENILKQGIDTANDLINFFELTNSAKHDKLVFPEDIKLYPVHDDDDNIGMKEKQNNKSCNAKELMQFMKDTNLSCDEYILSSNKQIHESPNENIVKQDVNNTNDLINFLKVTNSLDDKYILSSDKQSSEHPNENIVKQNINNEHNDDSQPILRNIINNNIIDVSHNPEEIATKPKLLGKKVLLGKIGSIPNIIHVGSTDQQDEQPTMLRMGAIPNIIHVGSTDQQDEDQPVLQTTKKLRSTRQYNVTANQYTSSDAQQNNQNTLETGMLRAAIPSQQSNQVPVNNNTSNTNFNTKSNNNSGENNQSITTDLSSNDSIEENNNKITDEINNNDNYILPSNPSYLGNNFMSDSSISSGEANITPVTQSIDNSDLSDSFTTLSDIATPSKVISGCSNSNNFNYGIYENILAICIKTIESTIKHAINTHKIPTNVSKSIIDEVIKNVIRELTGKNIDDIDTKTIEKVTKQVLEKISQDLINKMNDEITSEIDKMQELKNITLNRIKDKEINETDGQKIIDDELNKILDKIPSIKQFQDAILKVADEMKGEIQQLNNNQKTKQENNEKVKSSILNIDNDNRAEMIAR